MPARVIDGSGLWRSSKIRQVAECYRAEYANLLPLAEANGVFDCDPDRVWSDVYAFNRTDITVDTVEAILDELERVDLLRRWKQDGKVWGFWTGINKSGRLPGEAHLKRYKNLPPNAPTSISEPLLAPSLVPDKPLPNPSWIGIGLDRIGSGMGKPENQNEILFTENRQGDAQVKAVKQIPILCQNILKKKADMWPNNVAAIQRLEVIHKGSAVTRAFGDWALENLHEGYDKPVTMFLMVADDILCGEDLVQNSVVSSVVDDLVRELVFMSQNLVAFDDRHKSRLAKVLSDNTQPSEVKSAFHRFLNKLDENDAKSVRYAAKTFVETVDQYIYANRRIAEDKAREAATTESAKERMQREAEDSRKARQEAQIQEDLLVEDELPD